MTVSVDPSELSSRGQRDRSFPTHILLQEIVLRVFRHFLRKGRSESLALAEIRKCRLLGRDSVSPGCVLDKDCFERLIN
jgi:hypothetical protein